MKNQFALAACTEAAETDVLIHHGIIGMKWGVRRYQPYPSDYDGDGVYKGKPPRKTFKERRAERKAAKEERDYAEKRDMALKKLDYKTITKHPDWYSDEEIAAALTKSKQIKDITDNMSTAKGADFVKKANAWNTAASAARATASIGTVIASTALTAYNIAEKADKLKKGVAAT